MKKLYEKYHHVLPILVYAVIYLAWFRYIEVHGADRYRVIHMALDDRIPFIEYFVIPYYIWFAYIIAIVVYLMIFDKEKKGYYNCITFMISGMTVFLVISTLFPNIQHLRPYVVPTDNICGRLVKYMYSIDTPTNLWPSIHVYNSIAAYIAVAHDKRLGANKWINGGCLILSVSIILSTVFIKQHSLFDVMTAFIMAAIVYVLVYRLDVIVSMREAYRVKHEEKEKAFNLIK